MADAAPAGVSFESLLQALAEEYKSKLELVASLRLENEALGQALQLAPPFSERPSGRSPTATVSAREVRKTCSEATAGTLGTLGAASLAFSHICSRSRPVSGDAEGAVFAERAAASLMSTQNVRPEILPESTEVSGEPGPSPGNSRQTTPSPCGMSYTSALRKSATFASVSAISATSSYRKSAMIPDLHHEWQAPKRDHSMRILSNKYERQPTGLCSVEDVAGSTMPTAARSCQRFIISPNSLFRLVWDLVSAVMVCYDVITIPLMAINLEDEGVWQGKASSPTGFTRTMDWVTIIFWSTDVVWSFVTGFHTDGLVEMRAAVVAKNYLKGWFSFDFIVLFVEWGSMYLENDKGAQFLGFLRIGKTARLLRIARTVRLLRFVKLHNILAEFFEIINSQVVRAALNITLAFAFIFVFSHYLACGWYLAGYVGKQMGVINWLDDFELAANKKNYAYFTALHWSLTQFTPAGSEIHPTNLGERVYAICSLNFALVVFSSFLGSITASITELRNKSKDASQQEFVLRAYLARNNVSYRLSRKIWRFLKENHFKHQRRKLDTALTTLKLLPPHLHIALYQELYTPYLTRTPFFHQYTAFWREGLVDVCTKGISEQSMLCGESLFTEGRVAEKMFFVASGCAHYDHHNPDFNQLCGLGAWISEACLWVRWTHMATLYANTTCDVIELDSAKFRHVMEVYKRSLTFVRAYSRQFHEHLKELGAWNLSDVMNDVRCLQRVTRAAWHEAACGCDRNLFKEMANLEYPTSPEKSFVGSIWRKKSTRSASHV